MHGNGQDGPISGKVCVVTVCADIDTIGTVTRVSSQLFVNPVVGAMPRYLPQNHDQGILEEMKNADAVLCVIDFDSDRNGALETTIGLQTLLGTKLMAIALARKSTSSLVIEAMRAGCVEYLTKPADADQLTQALMRLRTRWAPPRRSDNAGEILAFLSSRGGAGATTVVINLAGYLSQVCGKKTLIIDQQRQLGHVSLYMGLPPGKYHFYDLVRNVSRLDMDLLRSFLLHASTDVDVIPAPNELFAITDATLEDVHQTLKFLRGQYDFILIDCPHGLGRHNIATIEDCDKLYLVATPDIPALRDLSRYVDRLTQYHFPPGKVNVVINRFKSKGEVGLEEIGKAVKQPVAITIPNSSAELITAMNTGKPLPPGGSSEFSRHMRKWATSLAKPGLNPKAEPEPKKRKLALAFWN
jgi:pilus assembly protein CpaE